VTLLSWVAKALVMRGHVLAAEPVALLLDLLASPNTACVGQGVGPGTHTHTHEETEEARSTSAASVSASDSSVSASSVSASSVPSVGAAAADGIFIVMSDAKEVLTQKMRANTRLMYKQRFFQENVPVFVKVCVCVCMCMCVCTLPPFLLFSLRASNQFTQHTHTHTRYALCKAYHEARADSKQNYLRGISHMLRCVPKQVLVSELPALLPVLVESLASAEVAVVVSSLDTLYTLVFDTPELMAKASDSIVDKALALAAHPVRVCV
jgi:hypothetical protein